MSSTGTPCCLDSLISARYPGPLMSEMGSSRKMHIEPNSAATSAGSSWMQ
jgi:hypothetical protein